MSSLYNKFVEIEYRKKINERGAVLGTETTEGTKTVCLTPSSSQNIGENKHVNGVM